MFVNESPRSGRSRLSARCLFLLLLVPLSGCITLQRQGSDDFAVDAVRYGVTEGRFRGRWWNYYERGRSLLEGGFYDDARKDLETALLYRERDQLWPRTYGLHFTPEYFPHRELGIVHYHQGDVNSALRELELSLQQRYSARAAYYIGQARRAALEASGLDTEAPRIDTVPVGEPIGAMTYGLRGVARDDHFVASLVVGGVPFDIRVSAPEVPFEVEVPLGPGRNEIEIVCTDLTGKSTAVRTAIEADLDGPMISFDAPMVLPGTVSGVAYDSAGVAALEIAGIQAAISPGADAPAVFSVQLSRRDLETSAVYRCEDGLGNVTQGVLSADLILLKDQMPSVVPAATMEAVTLPGGQRLFYLANEIFAMASSTDATSGPKIKIANIEDGQQYYSEEIAVNIELDSDQPIESLVINGETVPTLARRSSMRVSHRIKLDEGENEILGQVQDAGGRIAEERKTIRREPDETDFDKNRMSVALLRSESLADSPGLEELTETVLKLLNNDTHVNQRFTPVDRDMLSQILTEQSLSATLASKEGKLALGKLVPADMLLVVRVRQDAESVEIVLDGTSTETGVRIASHIDAAGPVTEIDRVVGDLALRLLQEFPRVQGMVLDWSAPQITFDLTTTQRIRPYLKCVVFSSEEFKHPITKQSLGMKHTVIAEGTIQAVGATFSEAQIYPREGEVSVDALPIEVGNHIVIK